MGSKWPAGDLCGRVLGGRILPGGVATPFAQPVGVSPFVVPLCGSVDQSTISLNRALPPPRVRMRVFLIGRFAHDLQSRRPPSRHPDDAACHSLVPLGSFISPFPALPVSPGKSAWLPPRSSVPLHDRPDGFPSFGPCLPPPSPWTVLLCFSHSRTAQPVLDSWSPACDPLRSQTWLLPLLF